MPCNKLAVQTATLTENFTALLLDADTIEMLRHALANISKTKVGLYKAKKFITFFVGDVTVYVDGNGRIDASGANKERVSQVIEMLKPLATAAAQRATQNMVLVAMQRAGVSGLDETTASNGARVVQFNLL